MKHKHVILGGTFDHLHIGHKSLLDKAFAIGEKVSLGICTDAFIKEKFLNQSLEYYPTRKNAVVNYLKSKGLLKRTKIIAINDIYGTSISDPGIEAIIVSKETSANAEKVNKLRHQMGFNALKIITVPFIRGKDKNIITSERIRLGEIDCQGNAYLSLFKKPKLILPQHLRQELRIPIGQVLKGGDKDYVKIANEIKNIIAKTKPVIVITVGDDISNALSKIGYFADVKIIDFRTRRKNIAISSIMTNRSYPNDPGTINQQAVYAIKNAFDKYLKMEIKQTIIIKGEEDLLALPAILLAPIKSLVIYGQWNLGVVVVEVTLEKKKKVMEYINRFT